MKTTTLSIILFLFTVNMFSQINIADSTVNVVAYWDKGEKQDYTIIKTRTKIENGDTTSVESVRYEVELSVVDSTANSYTMQWIYKDVISDNKNPFVAHANKTVKGLKILYSTDEMGVYKEILNWEEINQYMQKQYDLYRDLVKSDPEMVDFVNKSQAIYANKSLLEASGFKEIKQFHNFYGGAFKLGEIVKAEVETSSPFSSEPVMADLSVLLSGIDTENSFYVMESLHSINQEQLGNMAFNAVKQIGEGLDVDLPKREDFVGLSNETYIVSSIHHWGWILYSELTTTVNVGNATNIDECSIELK